MLAAQGFRAAEVFLGQKLPERLIEDAVASVRKSISNIVLIGMPGSGKSTIGKIIADSLNGIAYADDSCIVEATISKFYDIYPRTEITIENLYTDSDM